MAERALELLALPEDKPAFLLDIGEVDIFLFSFSAIVKCFCTGCGTGISGSVLAANGHAWGRGTRAVFQFYPENEQQSALIMSQATKAGFNGGLVIDYPNSVKAKKVYLVLMTGGIAQLPKALTGEEEMMQHHGQIENTGRFVQFVARHEK
ncbi:unnamed protein product [Cylicostephanus goldi]|uniref:Uncharacterized protein n=1 Tax=Cylicostephanus goldi TaxID=71465 RepID=A0A3P7MX45_CYLGO|nr:unnamed protein product [Cylicostephanus goldi]